MILRNSLRDFYQNGRRLMAALHRARARVGGKTLLYRKRRFAWELRYSRPEVTSEVTRRKLASAVCKAGRHPGSPPSRPAHGRPVSVRRWTVGKTKPPASCCDTPDFVARG